MAKKISFLILSVSILVIGVIAFSKLRYWDRSARIFSFRSDIPFEGRMARGSGGREEFARFEMHELPDSMKVRFGAREGRPGPGMSERIIPDSLRQQLRSRNGEHPERGSFKAGIRNGEGRGRGEFPGGKKINIRNVKLFLAVFASFTVNVIYIDKVICLIRKRKSRQETIKEIN